MNKFLVVLLFIRSSLTIRLRDVPVDTIYEAVVSIFKGLDENNEHRCYGVLEKHKNKILNIVNTAIDKIKSGTPIVDALSEAAVKLIAVDGFITECNALAMPAIITKLTTKDGLVEVFQAVIDNIDTIYDYVTNIVNAIKTQEYNTAGENLGKILALVLNFHVNLYKDGIY